MRRPQDARHVTRWVVTLVQRSAHDPHRFAQSSGPYVNRLLTTMGQEFKDT